MSRCLRYSPEWLMSAVYNHWRGRSTTSDAPCQTLVPDFCCNFNFRTNWSSRSHHRSAHHLRRDSVLLLFGKQYRQPQQTVRCDAWAAPGKGMFISRDRFTQRRSARTSIHDLFPGSLWWLHVLVCLRCGREEIRFLLHPEVGAERTTCCENCPPRYRRLIPPIEGVKTVEKFEIDLFFLRQAAQKWHLPTTLILSSLGMSEWVSAADFHQPSVKFSWKYHNVVKCDQK